MTFDTLTLSSDILRALPAQMTTPTRIQQQAIPAVLRGSDVLALAQTGSGKTLAFGLPMLQRIDTGVNQVQGVVLVPTRELAAQVSVALNQVATPLGIKVVMLCGGVDQAQQITELENAQLVVATTGRLLDFINQGVVSLDAMTVWAMDEADRLLEMGFWPDVQRIMAAMPAKRQTLLFSATMPAALETIADSLLFKPVRIEAHEKNSVVEDIEERLYLVNKGSKAQALIALIKQHDWKQLLVFVAEKGSADAWRKGWPKQVCRWQHCTVIKISPPASKRWQISRPVNSRY